MSKSTPRYITVYHEIKNDILSGKYPAGSFLPTEGELETLYNTSRTTIRNAIAVLRNEHLIDVRQGRGTQVIHRKTDHTAFTFPSIKSSAEVSNEFLCPGEYTVGSQGAIVDRIPAGPAAATALGLKPGAEVYRLQRDKLVNNVIFCYTVSYVPCHLTPGLEKYNGEILFLYQFLNETYHIQYLSSKISVSAVSAGFIETRLLNVQSGAPLLQNCRIAFSKDGPFEYNESLFRPDLMKMVINMSAEPPESLD